MKKLSVFIILVALSATLAGCYGVNVPASEQAEPLAVPQDARPSPFRLGKVVLAIPRGETIASVSPRGVGILCGGSYGMVQRSKITQYFEKDTLRDMFNDTMEAVGYDISGSSSIMFDEDDDELRSLFTVGARVTDIKMDLCERRTFWLSHDLGVQGEASMTVEWTVYDRLRRNTVYKTVTRGYSRIDMPNYEGIGLLLDDSFAASAHNLGADRMFFDLIVNGKIPSGSIHNSDKLHSTSGGFDPMEAVSIAYTGLQKKPLVPDTLNIARQVAVLISAGSGHGSGFFVTSDGHILTNQHVVGDSTLVRVVTHNGKHKLVAEVLRQDKIRDVALLRVQKMPPGFNPMLLPIRLDIPLVGEKAYAIGAPLQEKSLQDTVTHGIISAWRPQHRFNRQSYIQADIPIQPGNSGGPLIDENGNITGIAVSGVTEDSGAMAGLNYFIPIAEAFDRLDISEPARSGR